MSVEPQFEIAPTGLLYLLFPMIFAKILTLLILHVLLVMQDIHSYLVIRLLFQFILETFAQTNTTKIVEEFTY